MYTFAAFSVKKNNIDHIVNLEDYIKSGVLELYVLNLLEISEREEIARMVVLHPRIRQEIYDIERTLEQHALSAGLVPAPGLKTEILQAVAESAAAQKKLPQLIHKHAVYQDWLNHVAQHFPEAQTAANFMAVITEQENWKQLLVVSSFDIAPESHEDQYESFLILKGKCRCTVGTAVFDLEAGGFTRIPLATTHDVAIIDGPVMAIVQYSRF